MITTTDVGNVTEGPGVPDHQVVPIGGAWHVQAFLLSHLFRGFLPLQCAVGLSPTDSALQ